MGSKADVSTVNPLLIIIPVVKWCSLIGPH